MKVREILTEGLKLVHTATGEGNGRVAKVYKDSEWEEFRVKHFIDGKHQTEADYHDDDKTEVVNHANTWAKGGK